MPEKSRNRRFSKYGAMAVAAIALGALTVPLHPATAAPFFLGWDFGGGVGVGIGTPPSAYGYHYYWGVPYRGPYNYPF